MNTSLKDSTDLALASLTAEPVSRHDLVTEAFVAFGRSITERAIRKTIANCATHLNHLRNHESHRVSKEAHYSFLDHFRKLYGVNHKDVSNTSRKLMKSIDEIFDAMLKGDSNIDLHERASVTANSRKDNDPVILHSVLHRIFMDAFNEINNEELKLPGDYKVRPREFIPNFELWIEQNKARAARENMELLPASLVKDEANRYLKPHNEVITELTQGSLDSIIRKISYMLKPGVIVEDLSEALMIAPEGREYWGAEIPRSRYRNAPLTHVAVAHALIELSNLNFESIRAHNYFANLDKFAYISETSSDFGSEDQIISIMHKVGYGSNFSDRKLARAFVKLEAKLEAESAFMKDNPYAQNRYKNRNDYSPELMAHVLKVMIPEKYGVVKLASHAEISTINPFDSIFKALRSNELVEVESHKEKTVVEQIQTVNLTTIISSLTDLGYFVIEPSVAQLKYANGLLKMLENAYELQLDELAEGEAVSIDALAHSVLSARTQSVATAMIYAREAAVLFDGKSEAHADSLVARNSVELIDYLERLDSNILHLVFGLIKL